jgi:hypothetical protein
MRLLFFGGFVVTFVSLLIATVARSTRGLKWFYLVLAFCGLIYEGGCFAFASGFGKAMGGGGDDDTLSAIIAIAFLVAIIWTILIFLWASADKKDSSADEHGKTRRPSKRIFWLW